ncbi:Formylmethanofuran dehydrogenase subunit A [hydrothermal vent metagenome]|uniref:Formylmethanofuran dehydrogenase subunit A n=1 Tax=hydrothermal vent metagenome TaxID=652676 RepID=A0A3B1CK18_9ZZZZ
MTIENGQVIDPANSEDSVSRPLYIQDGKVTDSAGNSPEKLDATGCVVMPGGVDIHTHVAGAGSQAQLAQAEQTGLLYGQMGYTTLLDPALYPALSPSAHKIAQKIPQTDKGFLAILSPQAEALKLIEKKDWSALKNFISHTVTGSMAHSLKLVNPGGEVCHYAGIDKQLDGFNVTPRKMITAVSNAITELSLPHPLHLHLNDTGTTAGYKTAIGTIELLEGREAHIPHMQFSTYGEKDKKTVSMAPYVAEKINLNKNISIDIGQVVFGSTVTITADNELAQRLRHVTGNSGHNIEAGHGCALHMTQYEYSSESVMNSMQWTAGLELALLVDDPWQVFISTDHPNGGPFTAYPYIINLLMNKDFRDEEFSRIHPKAQNNSPLKNISREYSLYEIAIATRCGPARRLGLANKGTLKTCADADIAIYKKDNNFDSMFRNPAWVIKGGEITAKDGKTIKMVEGRNFKLSNQEPV